MSLQRRLAYLLAAFAAFSLAATFGTIYGIQLQVKGAMLSLRRSLDETLQIDRLRLESRERCFQLHEVVNGVRQVDEWYKADRDGFFTRLDQVARFAAGPAERGDAIRLLELCATLQETFTDCEECAFRGDTAKAKQVLSGRLEQQLLPALDRRLVIARDILEETRGRSIDQLVTTNTHVLTFSALIGVFGVGMVTAGTAVIRRWVILPVRDLQQATRQFGQGNLDVRVQPVANDELGDLGVALNSMAGSLSGAQADLRASEAKYRSLFENLRDTTVICDAAGRVIECHEGASKLLGAMAADQKGRFFLEVWPHWRTEGLDWPALIERVITEGKRVQLSDMMLTCEPQQAEPATVDVIAYPVVFADDQHVAIVLRDVTERHRLERQTRHAEAMEATVNFARGVAHDFHNMLTSAISSLSLETSAPGDARRQDRVGRALRACRQAAGLSRKLQEFASADQGDPQPLCLKETVELILSAFDETFFDGIQLETVLDQSVFVRVDRDQMTQVVLNLSHNAKEAMPQGGQLRIEVGCAHGGGSDGSRAPGGAVLTVADSGQGMTREVRERIFEPFFSTKDRDSRSRGMGLAVVHAAVRNMGGTIRAEAEPGVGSIFRVTLPLEDSQSVRAHSHDS
ncbi:MAG: ATP-binding protein [Phycisphaerae bacterium]